MPNQDQDRRWLTLAIDLSHQCPPSKTAFSVGAVIVDEHGREISRGYSREKPHQHAEESALSKLPPADQRLTHATLYSSLEPCTSRKSHKRTCTELIITARIPRVVIAWREPPIFVTNPHGIDALQTAGVTVTQYHDLAETAAAANTHIHTTEGK